MEYFLLSLIDTYIYKAKKFFPIFSSLSNIPVVWGTMYIVISSLMTFMKMIGRVSSIPETTDL